jgi:hypothetical protein
MKVTRSLKYGLVGFGRSGRAARVSAILPPLGIRRWLLRIYAPAIELAIVSGLRRVRPGMLFDDRALQEFE